MRRLLFDGLRFGILRAICLGNGVGLGQTDDQSMAKCEPSIGLTDARGFDAQTLTSFGALTSI